MKRLSSNEDPIRVEHKGKQAFYARPTHSLVMATNNAPRMLSLDVGVRRRMIFIPFNAVVPLELQNGRISEDLIEDREAILDWLVIGAVKFVARQKIFFLSKASLEANEAFFADNDPLTEFFEDRLEVTKKDTDRLVRGVLFDAYTKHGFAGPNRKLLSKKEFYNAVRARNHKEQDSNGGRYFLGLKFVSDHSASYNDYETF